MRIVYLRAPHLPVQVERRRLGKETGPLIVGGRPWDSTVVLDCCAQAEAACVTPGMPLARAALRCPEARFLPADHAAYQEAHEQLEAALRQFTDRVETEGLGILLVETTQLSRRFPEGEALAKAMIAAIHDASPIEVKLGLAERRYTAEQAALAARPNDAVIVPPQRDRAFLAGLPLTALPAETEILRRLDLLGIHTLSGLAALPRLALIRQFGTQAGFLHDLASGRDPRPVMPDAPPLELRHSHALEPPATDSALLLAIGRRLATALARTLQKQSYQAQGLRVQLTDITGTLATTATAVEPPTADEGRLARRVLFLVDRLELRRPIVEIELVVYPLRPTYLGATQLALFSASPDQRWRGLQEALRRLRARFGELVVMIASLIASPSPHPIQVTLMADIPRTIVWERRLYHVRQIYEHWRERRFWWAQPVERDYYRLEDATGQVRVIYQDLRTSSWWLERRRL